jgi:murein DD-endopeptidase MepM/ murein hydrolase activator NlpD
MGKSITVVVMLGWLAAAVVAASTDSREAGRRPKPAQAAAATKPPAAAIEVQQGSLVRWSVPGTKRCGMAGRTWAAVQETCYYPIDVASKPGIVRVTRHGTGPAATAVITVLAVERGSQSIVLGDIPQAHPTPADLRRNAREQAEIERLWSRPEGPATFALPLGAPLAPLPEGKGFGSLWVFNAPPDTSELHSGADFDVRAGTPVAAVADGTVVIAQDLFFSGNSVFVDHGDGLVTMCFHLSEISVRPGEAVKKGQRLGLVGQTGRVTGPHLHLGVRWHGARVDPRLLLDDPARIPAIGAESRR